MQEADDHVLMDALKVGDRAAFRVLFRRHAPSLQRFVYRFVGSQAVAEEMVQEIMFKIYRAAPSYEPRGQFTTYLYRVATNHCLNEVRKADYRHRFDSIEQQQEEGVGRVAQLADRRPTQDETLWLQTMTDQLQSFLLELPENQRAALLLHGMEALSYQEIAEALVTSVSAVKSLIHRARQSLRQRFEVWHEEAGNAA